MANIEIQKEKIRSEKFCYGMREHFCDALDSMKSEVEVIRDGITTTNGIAEVIDARDGETSLGNKIRSMDSDIKTVEDSLSEHLLNHPSGGTSGSSYVHPDTHPASMITGLSNVAKSGLYSDLLGTPTNLSDFNNDIGLGNSGSASGTDNTLDGYAGATLNDKMKAMFNDINTNKKNTPMVINLPAGIIEITEDLVANGWTNKVVNCPGVLYFNGCNGIVFKQIQHCNIYIHRVSSEIPSVSNPQGFISISAVDSLTKNGIKISDCSYNNFTIDQILGFDKGLWLYSEYGALGTFYNNIYLNAIWRCKQGLLLTAGKAADDGASISGWVNDNRLFNAMFDCNRCVQIGLPYGSRPVGEPTDSYHNNKFYSFGFEKIRDASDPVAIDMKQGVNNSFLYPRFEASMTNAGYIFIREGKNAVMNRYETSGYWMNINRLSLNTSSVKDEGTTQGKQYSVVVASFVKEGSGILANKMTAIKNKVVYEGYGIDNYYFAATDTSYCSPNNMINYTFADTEFAKYRNSTGTIKTIGFTS